MNMISAKPSMVFNIKSNIDFSSSNTSSSSCSSSSKSSFFPILSSSSNVVTSAQSSSSEIREQQTSVPSSAPASTLHIPETGDLWSDFYSSCSCSSSCNLVAAAAIRAAAIHAATNEHQGRAHHRLISLMKVPKGRLIM